MQTRNSIPERVSNFIKEHHVLTIASASINDIWCANAFYSYIPEENLLVITSQESTRHIQIAKESLNSGLYPSVAGTIVLETETIGKIQGLQFKADLIKIEDTFSHYRYQYLKRFPYALLKGGELWLLKFKELKFTDNRLGFGKKINIKLEDNFKESSAI